MTLPDRPAPDERPREPRAAAVSRPAETPDAHATDFGAGPLEIVWRDEAACASFAGRVARLDGFASPRHATRVALDGGLGAGKTTFVRHLLRALGVDGRIKSPTYAVLEPYELADGTPVAHIDAYRLDDAAEALDAGLRERFESPGLVLVEWPAKLGAAWPAPDWTLRLLAVEGDDDEGPGAEGARRVTVRAGSARGARWLDALRDVGAAAPGASA